MKHIVVDLEMNSIKRKSEARRICSSEIIEIGAVMLDETLQEIASFRTYVKPEYNDVIAPNIRDLTGITNEMVANAPHFKEAFKMFAGWALGTDDEVVFHAWSDSDYQQLQKEMRLKEYVPGEEEAAVMTNAWNDFQNEFDKRLGFERQLSLSLALDMAGIDFAGREHDALDDARNTAELLQVVRDEELFEKTLRKIEEAMKPVSLGNTIGSLYDFSKLVFE